MTLHKLAKSGNVSGLRQYLENDPRDVNSLNDVGKTPLLCADYTKPELISLLLQHGADVHIKAPYHGNAPLYAAPLYQAVASKCVESVRLILDAGASLTSDEEDLVPLCIAVERGMMSIAKLLLERGVDPNMDCGEEMSPINIAAKKDDESMVNLLVEHGAKVNQADAYGHTPLFYAVKLSNTTITRRLIELGANVNQPIAMEETILHWAVQAGHLEQVKILVENGANLSADPECICTVLHDAVSMCWESSSRFPKNSLDPQSGARCLGLVEYLLESGADCDKPDHDGVTPLFLALERTDLDIVRCLLERGANLRAKDYNGLTALHYAARNWRSAEVLEFVLDQGGFHVEDRDKKGFTALHWAAWIGNNKNCAILVRRGADVNAKCNEGRSPLFHADELSTMKLLIRHGAAAAEGLLSAMLNNYEDDEDDWEKICFVLRLLAKLECLSEDLQDVIGTEDRETIEKDKAVGDYFRACVAELRRMEVCKIFEDISLTDILTKSESVLAGYARNEELVQGFKKKNSKEEFPIFAPIVAERFEEVVEMQRKIMTAATTLDGILGLTSDPGHIIYRKIFGYMKDQDDFKHLWTKAS